MRMQGVKVLDPPLETVQVEWLVVSTAECPDPAAEQRIVASYFRIPHNAWGAVRAFVRPVQIRRSRRRVLFFQQSGIDP